jgi:hypothetical protein
MGGGKSRPDFASRKYCVKSTIKSRFPKLAGNPIVINLRINESPSFEHSQVKSSSFEIPDWKVKGEGRN